MPIRAIAIILLSLQKRFRPVDLSIKCQRATERDNEKIELYDLVSASPLPAFCRGGLSLLPGADASAFRAPSPRLRLVRGVFGCASDRRGAAAQGRTGQYDGLDAGSPMVYLRLPAADRLSLRLLFRFVVRSASEFQSGRGALRCRMCRMARMGSGLGQTSPAGERSRNPDRSTARRIRRIPDRAILGSAHRHARAAGTGDEPARGYDQCAATRPRRLQRRFGQCPLHGTHIGRIGYSGKASRPVRCHLDPGQSRRGTLYQRYRRPAAC